MEGRVSEDAPLHTTLRHDLQKTERSQILEQVMQLITGHIHEVGTVVCCCLLHCCFVVVCCAVILFPVHTHLWSCSVQFALKHDTARIIQCCLKYGTPQHQTAIFNELKGTSGTS